MYDQPPPPPPPSYHMETNVLERYEEENQHCQAVNGASMESIPFSELRCNSEDIEKIEDIIVTMGTNGKISLLMHHKSRLEKKGDELTVVHPLKFVSYIHNKPQLKKYLREIMGDYFKRSNFTKDLFKRFNEEYHKGTMTLYAEGFAEETGLPVDTVSKLVNSQNWTGLIKLAAKK